ncbi:MAG: hypothetical protein MI919_28155 [Holophagales bacterium]|nr:hypothetical protein [Holophagales bacterium]
MSFTGNARSSRTWLGILAALVLLLGGVWGLRSWIERERLRGAAESFVEKAPEQARQLRGIFTRRAHDLRSEIGEVRRQLAAIVEELGLDRRPHAFPRARLEVGRLYLALGDLHGAGHFLGPLTGSQPRADSPELALARGVAYGELYLQGLRWIEILPEKEAARFLGRARAEWREVALASFEWARGSLGKQQAWADAFSLHLRNAGRRVRPEEAARYLAGRRGSFDDHLLLGRIRAAASRSRTEVGRIVSPAPEGTAETADEALRRAITLAPSDPRPYLEACDLWSTLLVGALEAGSRDLLAAHRARAEVACNDGLKILAESVPLLLERAALDLAWIPAAAENGGDPSASAERCRSAAGSVVAMLERPAELSDWRFAPAGGLARNLAEAAARHLIERSEEESSSGGPDGPAG